MADTQTQPSTTTDPAPAKPPETKAPETAPKPPETKPAPEQKPPDQAAELEALKAQATALAAKIGTLSTALAEKDTQIAAKDKVIQEGKDKAKADLLANLVDPAYASLAPKDADATTPEGKKALEDWIQANPALFKPKAPPAKEPEVKTPARPNAVFGQARESRMARLERLYGGNG